MAEYRAVLLDVEKDKDVEVLKKMEQDCVSCKMSPTQRRYWTLRHYDKERKLICVAPNPKKLEHDNMYTNKIWVFTDE